MSSVEVLAAEYAAWGRGGGRSPRTSLLQLHALESGLDHDRSAAAKPEVVELLPPISDKPLLHVASCGQPAAFWTVASIVADGSTSIPCIERFLGPASFRQHSRSPRSRRPSRSRHPSSRRHGPQPRVWLGGVYPLGDRCTSQPSRSAKKGVQSVARALLRGTQRAKSSCWRGTLRRKGRGRRPR